MVLWWLRFADQTSEDSSQGDRLFHGPPGRGWCEGLEVEGQVVLDRGGRLHRLYFESGADVGQGTRTEG